MQGLRNAPIPQNAGILVIFPQIARNSTRFLPVCEMATPQSATFSACQPGEHGDLQTLVTGVSGYVGAALVPRLRPRRPRRARLRPLARARRGRGRELDDLVLGDATTGAGLDAALDGVDVAYYLIHSMEGAAADAFVDVERRQAEAFAAAAAARPACGGSSTSAGCCRTTARSSRHLALAAGGRAGAARRRAGVGRAARLDRDRAPARARSASSCG